MMGSGDIPMSAIRNQVVSALGPDRPGGSKSGTARDASFPITDVVGLEGEVPVLEDLWAYDPGRDRFECSGARPSFLERVEDAGFGTLLNASMNRSHSTRLQR